MEGFGTASIDPLTLVATDLAKQVAVSRALTALDIEADGAFIPDVIQRIDDEIARLIEVVVRVEQDNNEAGPLAHLSRYMEATTTGIRR